MTKTAAQRGSSLSNWSFRICTSKRVSYLECGQIQLVGHLNRHKPTGKQKENPVGQFVSVRAFASFIRQVSTAGAGKATSAAGRSAGTELGQRLAAQRLVSASPALPCMMMVPVNIHGARARANLVNQIENPAFFRGCIRDLPSGIGILTNAIRHATSQHIFHEDAICQQLIR